ncbi:hypothetical protein M9Y10_032686 [Tritrichomonas musculus]|uniref:Aminotransferase class I/classII large domain-containing protein n=1 Tax=Tritrichomonas musculus TaxID=1915356 RepID=A0ABR2GXJ9_9EUKA
MALKQTRYIQRLKAAPESPLWEGYWACSKDPNIINLGTAENRVMDELLQPIIEHRKGITTKDETYFANLEGQLNDALASLYHDYFDIKEAKPSQFLFGSGIAFLVEKLGLVLCDGDDGDIILIPKPCYGCFEPDLSACAAKVEYIDLDHLPEKPPEKARLLILTNPGNPIGDIIENPEKILEWCYQNPYLHVVTDDVYALSNRHGKSYHSIAGLKNAKPEVVHQFYGMSKDWGLAGCNVGFFWTRNNELLDLMRIARGCFHLSSDTQWLCIRLLDQKYGVRDNWIKQFRKNLSINETKMMKILDDGQISYRKCENSLFLMIDLRDLVKGSKEKELDVWRSLMLKYKVHILPGAAGFHMDEPGFYRVIFSIPDAELTQGLQNLVKGVQELRDKINQ